MTAFVMLASHRRKPRTLVLMGRCPDHRQAFATDSRPQHTQLDSAVGPAKQILRYANE
jgi:hypothetical protein